MKVKVREKGSQIREDGNEPPDYKIVLPEINVVFDLERKLTFVFPEHSVMNRVEYKTAGGCNNGW